jgi:hypothetical protein
LRASSLQADKSPGFVGNSSIPRGDVPALTFEDSVGTLWEVFEVHRASEALRGVSAGLEKGWLAFISATEKRRLAPYPSTWASASIAELERLCEAARRATPTRLPSVAQGSLRIRTGPPRAAALDASAPAMVRDVVRSFALDARAHKLPAIEAMVRLKSMLGERFGGEDVSAATRADAADMRQVRRWFVEAFYFERPA